MLRRGLTSGGMACTGFLSPAQGTPTSKVLEHSRCLGFVYVSVQYGAFWRPVCVPCMPPPLYDHKSSIVGSCALVYCFQIYIMEAIRTSISLTISLKLYHLVQFASKSPKWVALVP